MAYVRMFGYVYGGQGRMESVLQAVPIAKLDLGCQPVSPNDPTTLVSDSIGRLLPGTAFVWCLDLNSGPHTFEQMLSLRHLSSLCEVVF